MRPNALLKQGGGAASVAGDARLRASSQQSGGPRQKGGVNKIKGVEKQDGDDKLISGINVIMLAKLKKNKLNSYSLFRESLKE